MIIGSRENEPQALKEAVIILIYDQSTQTFLVEERADHPDGPVFPGGHVEEDESAHDSALREASEEFGLVNTKVIPLSSFEEESINRNTYLFHGFLAVVSNKTEVRNEEKRSILMWIHSETAHEYLTRTSSLKLLEEARNTLTSEAPGKD